MTTSKKCLFNFAASYSGGGYKRLYAYVKWFNENRGACFVIHPKCERFLNEFPNNKYFIANQQGYKRVFNDCSYLEAVENEIGVPGLYYSYGIPIYARFGRINWFHLSNVLPLGTQKIPLTFFTRLKLMYLGRKIKRNLHNADIISAESNYSLGLLGVEEAEKLFLSVNGSDDELSYFKENKTNYKEDIATVIGTYSYKALDDSYRIFEMLKEKNANLKLLIIGNDEYVPENLKSKPGVVVKGALDRQGVVDCLRKTKYYISNTQIENSYNAASEGMIFAEESYISNIGPHRELLLNTKFDEVSVAGLDKLMLHVNSENISIAHLKTWNDVISEMMIKVDAFY